VFDPASWDVLESVAPPERELVLRTAGRRRFRKGQAVFREGDEADSLHLVLDGRVAVRVLGPEGGVVTTAVLGPGATFGELALVDEGLRSASIDALEATETLVLDRGAFADLVGRHPTVAIVLVRVLASQVRRLNDFVVELHAVPADIRVLRRLDELAGTYDAGTDGELIVPLTQEEVATMAATTRPTVNAVLREAERAGIVQVARGRVTVLDRGALHARATG
jgi:CRP-like cAMP-binding protein